MRTYPTTEKYLLKSPRELKTIPVLFTSLLYSSIIRGECMASVLRQNDSFISTREVVQEFGYNLLLDVNNLEEEETFPSQI